MFYYAFLQKSLIFVAILNSILMAEPKYLYGASIQGIQGFIFKTNELKDIVGASELVEEICTKAFEEFIESDGKVVVCAAGNVKCIFESKEACGRAVLRFPKKVMEMAPGITISQAVVEVKADLSDFSPQVEELEKRLHIQRNKPMKSTTVGTMAMVRSRKTGLPAIVVKSHDGNTEYLDEATVAKRRNTESSTSQHSTLALAQKSFGNDDLSIKSIPMDIKAMTDKNDWIAIIHADGNGLGAIVAQKNTKPEGLKDFSVKLDKATTKAAQQTYTDIITAADFEPTGKVVPLRPVVLGGDDMTIICRADLAMDYATKFIRHFEENTKAMGNALTACAGIAYMKSSYPFYYGYRLAEALCGEAKKDAKQPERMRNGLAPSCIMFHKIQGSYIGSFSQIEDNELTLNTGHSLKFGPYYLEPMDGRWTVDQLRNHTAILNSEKGNVAKSDVRQWLTMMGENIEAAQQLKQRAETILDDKKVKDVFVDATTCCQRGNGIVAYPAYDMLALLTVENQLIKQ